MAIAVLGGLEIKYALDRRGLPMAENRSVDQLFSSLDWPLAVAAGAAMMALGLFGLYKIVREMRDR